MRKCLALQIVNRFKLKNNNLKLRANRESEKKPSSIEYRTAVHRNEVKKTTKTWFFLIFIFFY